MNTKYLIVAKQQGGKEKKSSKQLKTLNFELTSRNFGFHKHCVITSATDYSLSDF